MWLGTCTSGASAAATTLSASPTEWQSCDADERGRRAQKKGVQQLPVCIVRPMVTREPAFQFRMRVAPAGGGDLAGVWRIDGQLDN
jgi:hypothetical protein